MQRAVTLADLGFSLGGGGGGRDYMRAHITSAKPEVTYGRGP